MILALTTTDYVMLCVMFSPLALAVVLTLIDRIRIYRCQHEWYYPKWQRWGWNRIDAYQRQCKKCGVWDR